MPSPPIPKYHVLELTLAERIREGVYEAEGLPGERQLAAEFGVARVTVRHALERLAAEGLVVRKHRSRTVASVVHAARHSRVLRDHLEQFLARGRKDKRTVMELQRSIAAKPEIARALGLPPGSRVARIVRLRSHDGVAITYTEAFVPESLGQALTREALRRRAFLEVLEGIGVKIGSAEQAISAQPAAPPVARALGIALHAPVLKLDRVIRDESGRAVQLLRGWYRGDRFEFRMALSKADDATRVWVESR